MEVEERGAETKGCPNRNEFNFLVSARCFDNATVGDLFHDCAGCLCFVCPMKNNRQNYWWIYVDFKLMMFIIPACQGEPN